MDRYKKAIEAARKLDAEQAKADIFALADDPRWPAVFWLLLDYQHQCTLASAKAETGDAALKAVGRLSAVCDLMGRLQQNMLPKPKPIEEPPDE